MKVTKRQLKQIIREETARVLRREVPAPYQPDLSTHGPNDIAKNGAFHDYIIAGVSEMIGDEGLQAVPLEDIINNTKPNGRDDAYYEHVELWEEIVTEAIEYLAVPNGPMAEHRDREGNLVYTVNPDNMTEAVGEAAENVGLQQSLKDVMIATIKASTGGSDVDEGIVDTSIKQMLTGLGMIGA